MIEYFFEIENNRAVAFENNNVIGECRFSIEDDCWNIYTTKVKENYKGRGIARKLVELVINNASNNGYKMKAICSYAQKLLSKDE